MLPNRRGREHAQHWGEPSSSWRLGQSWITCLPFPPHLSLPYGTWGKHVLALCLRITYVPTHWCLPLLVHKTSTYDPQSNFMRLFIFPIFLVNQLKLQIIMWLTDVTQSEWTSLRAEARPGWIPQCILTRSLSLPLHIILSPGCLRSGPGSTSRHCLQSVFGSHRGWGCY